MKQLIYLLAVVAISFPVHGQTRLDVTMTVDSVQRQFILVKPSAPPPASGYPVVFMFHGSSGDGEKFYNNSGWKEKGEREGFVTIFPSSLEYCFLNDSGRQTSTTRWNNGESEEEKCPGVELKDDVHFVRRIIDTAASMLSIDRTRIYASGFSNGAVFTSKLAIEASDIFAALSASAGKLHPLDSGASIPPVPFVSTIGTDDRNVVASFGQPVPFNDSALLVLGRTIRIYLAAFNLAEVVDRKDSTAIAITWVFNTPANPNMPFTQYSYTVLKGLEHEYPNGSNYPIAAADYLWAFFNRHSLAGVDPVERAGPSRASVFPNPANDYFVIEGTGEAYVTIRSILGNVVFERKEMLGEAIAVRGIPAGVYLVDVVSGREHSTQTIVIR